MSFGHDGFDARFEEVQKIGVRRFGENVAYSYNIKDPLEAAVKGWMKSEGHRYFRLFDSPGLTSL